MGPIVAATLKALGTTAAAEAAKAAVKKVMELINRKSSTDSFQGTIRDSGKIFATTFAEDFAKAASKKVVEIIFNRKSAREPSTGEFQKHQEQITEELTKELTGEFQKHQEQITKELTGEFQKHQEQITKELTGELQKHQEQITKGLIEEFQKRQKQLAVLVGIVCIILGGLVGGSATWYVFQPGQHSEQIISLEELEKYEKARDAGLQALENYVIQNPNSPYISQAKALIQTYKGEE